MPNDSGMTQRSRPDKAIVGPVSPKRAKASRSVTGRNATGERLVPCQVARYSFREHEVRYQFAGKFVSGKEVLDVACGIGIGTDYLRRAGARRCIGLDVDLGAVEYAQAAYPACWYVRCDAMNMPIADSSLDIVVSFETIEHLSDPLNFLRECRRVLRPAGLLICSTPNRAISRWFANPFHVRELEAQEFLHLLAGVFDVTDAFGQHQRIYPLFPLRLAVVRVLDSLGLGNPIRKFLRRPSLQTNTEVEFSWRLDGIENELRPYVPRWLVQPICLIAIARKRC